MGRAKPDSTWEDRVLEWKASGKSVKTWCLKNSIPIATFYGWKARLEKLPGNKWKARLEKLPGNKSLVKPKAKEIKQEFIELKDQQSYNSWLILECEGVKIHLQANFDQLTLRRCLDCLRGVSC